MKDGKMIYTPGPGWQAQLSEEAWDRYNHLEKDMMNAGIRAEMADIMTPTYDRLCKSGLKAAVLLAASEQRPVEGSPIQVGLDHILLAIKYVEGWKKYADEVIQNIGHSADERQLERMVTVIRKNPGISRSQLMQQFHMNARNASYMFDTLTQRGVVLLVKKGATQTYFVQGDANAKESSSRS
jgi:hypothetical protein